MKGNSAFLLLVCVASLVPRFASATWVQAVRTASLGGNDVLPTPGSDGWGTAVFILDRNQFPPILEVFICNTVENNITAISVRAGNRMRIGDALYQFQGTLSSCNHQLFQIATIGNYTKNQQISDFLNGNWYVQIETVQFPNGDIRGQIENNDRFYAILSSEQTVPISSATNSRGVLTATFNPWNPPNYLAIDVTNDIPSPVSAAVYGGATFGRVGKLYYQFSQHGNQIFEGTSISTDGVENLFDELVYYQMGSEVNPSGDVRGQLLLIDFPKDVAFTARLNSKQAVPQTASTSHGCAVVSYDCTSRLMEYFLIHNVPNPIGAFVGAAPVQSSGKSQFALSRFTSPIYGSHILNPSQEWFLFNQELFFVILTPEAVTGSIRGQISVEFDFYAYASGSQVVPPVTTSYVGCANFKLENNNERLNFWIMHDVDDATYVEVYRGGFGQAGQPMFEFGNNAREFIAGNNKLVDDDDLQDFVTDRAYMNVKNPSHPDSVIRGQIYRVAPCEVTRDNKLTYSAENA